MLSKNSSDSLPVNKKNKGGKSPFLYFILPSILAVGAILIFPMFYALTISLFKWNLIDTGNNIFIWFNNYIDMFKDPEFWHSLWLQIGFVFIAIPIELIIGFFVSILLNREFPGAGLVRSLLLLPVFVLPVLSGLTWRLMLQPEYGAISYLLSLIGFKGTTWLADPNMAYIAVIIQDIWRMWPFMFMMIYAGLIALPKELLEAADMDGAGFWHKIRYIILPFLKPTLATAFLLRLIDALRIFSEVYVMTSGGPGNSTTLLSLYINKQAFEFFNVGYASAMGIFLLVLSFVIAYVVTKKMFNVKNGEVA